MVESFITLLDSIAQYVAEFPFTWIIRNSHITSKKFKAEYNMHWIIKGGYGYQYAVLSPRKL